MNSDDSSGYAAVLGDLVASQEALDRPALQERVADALECVNARVRARQQLTMTIGDEFQGMYAQLGDALNASMLVRLLLHGVTDVRFGIGWGAITTWDADRAPFAQDGPAWWRARAALEEVEAAQRRTGMPDGWRTAVRLDAATGRGAVTPLVEDGAMESSAKLAEPEPLLLDGQATMQVLVMFRDDVMARLDDRDARLVVDLLGGSTVTEAAAAVGISQQAASRRLRENGGYALVRSWDLLGSSS